MDLNDAETVVVRRSTRQRNKGAFDIDLQPREALKRKRDITVVTAPEMNNTDEGPPDKISKFPNDAGDGLENGDQNNTVEMDVEDDEDQNQVMSSEDESENCDADMKTKPLIQEDKIFRTLHVGNLDTEKIKTFPRQERNAHQRSPVSELPKLTKSGVRKSSSQISSKALSESSRTGFASSNLKPLETSPDTVTVRGSIRQYRKKMEEKVRDQGNYPVDLYPIPDGYRSLKRQRTHNHKPNNLSGEKQLLHGSKTELRKPVNTQAADTHGVCRWLQWAVFLLASLALGLMGFQHFPYLSIATELQKRLSYSRNFEARLAELKTLFPSQRPELWKRTEIHLKRHLNQTNPTEPVSLILTSGRGAEKTLSCLAQKLATAFSSTLNSSVLDIDATSKTAQDSDQVKLDIDKAMKEAFESGTLAAVIHRFEELPPGSTLIFYRYCDHENAAFKEVFLAFTVMLPVPELDLKLDLNAVEEQVQEYLKEKFISPGKTQFNRMDVDKLSGLWSRISHVILPVAAELMIEEQGCRE